MNARRRGSMLVAVTVALSACGGGSGDDPSPSPSRSPTRIPSPTPVLIGTEAVARWTAVWKDAFQRLADDLSEIVEAIRRRDVTTLRDALARMPGDAREAVRKIDEAGATPPGFEDEVRRLRGLVDQAAGIGPRLADDCLDQAGLACAADAATLLSVTGQMLDALKPFGVDIRFRVDL